MQYFPWRDKEQINAACELWSHILPCLAEQVQFSELEVLRLEFVRRHCPVHAVRAGSLRDEDFRHIMMTGTL